MIEAELGLPIDIHGGGHDLVFPHHENEIAQGRCAHDLPTYARYWMHNGFLTLEAEKMSKSLGNVLLVHDLVKQVPGEVVRWALLSAHYRAPLDWTGDLITQARSRWTGCTAPCVERPTWRPMLGRRRPRPSPRRFWTT
jgi:cysteinyl-tRNA synthetase